MPEQRSSHQNLISTLMETHIGRRDGVVRLERAAVKKQIVMQKGMLAFAESSAPDDHLALVLVRSNGISRSQLPEISAAMKAGRPSDQAILEIAKVDRSVLENGIREQAITIVSTLFSWEDCEMHLYLGDANLKRKMQADMPLPQLLVMAARRAVKNGIFPSAYRSLGDPICRSDSKYLLDFPLNNAEAYAHSLVSKPMRIEDLLPLLPGDEVGGRAAIIVLMLLGLLRLDRASPESHAGIRELSHNNEQMQKIDNMLARCEAESLYELLGVKSGADEAEIKEAYHALAREYHSDRFQSRDYNDELREKAGRLFTHIAGAYTTLSDGAARANYDEARLKEQGKPEASKSGAAAVEVDPEKNADALYRAGRLALKNGDVEKATQLLKECVWLNPKVAKYQHYLAVVLSENSRTLKEAEQAFLKALEIDCTLADSYVGLAKLYLKANLVRRAEMQLRQAQRWGPNNPEAARLLSEIDRLSGRKGWFKS